MTAELRIGVAEVDITPPVGTAMSGSLRPRASIGVHDPLYAKAIVLESRGQKLACVMLDLMALSRADGDKAVDRAAARTGIPAERIVWAATHTHTGPYTVPFTDCEPGTVNAEWLAALPSLFAQAVEQADGNLQPARLSRLRAFNYALAHNRRLLFKDGRAINTWNLGQADETMQCVGSAGPIDPEIGILAFDDEQGRLLAILYHFTLHTNTNFKLHLSGDYPAVVAARMRERFGAQVVSVFLPGACGDLNRTVGSYREIGDALADTMIPKLEQRQPVDGGVALGSVKREVVVPFRDFAADQEERISRSGWTAATQEWFREQVEIMRREGYTSASTVLQAWHIGETAFGSLPGELFVELGLKIKQESPFPWTFPVELGGDYLGYLVTRQAMEAGGYEALVGRTAKPSAEGVAFMVNQVLQMLGELHMRGKKETP